jgi:hypothetical protein
VFKSFVFRRVMSPDGLGERKGEMDRRGSMEVLTGRWVGANMIGIFVRIGEGDSASELQHGWAKPAAERQQGRVEEVRDDLEMLVVAAALTYVT